MENVTRIASWLAEKFRKLYRPVVLPLILLLVAYLLLVLPVGGGNIVSSLLTVWGASIVLMIIGVIYTENIFTTPKDALINSLNALLVSVIFLGSSQVNFFIAFIYSAAVLMGGIAFLSLYDRNKKINTLSKYVSYGGRAKSIFLITAVLSFVSFSSGSGSSLALEIDPDIIYLAAFYSLFLLLTDTTIVERIKNFPLHLFGFIAYEDVGFVKGNQSPNIVLAMFNTRSNLKISDLVVIGKYDPNSIVSDLESDGVSKKSSNYKLKERVGIVLDFIGVETDNNTVTARVFLLNESQKNLSSTKSGTVRINQECRRVTNPEEFIEQVDCKKVKHAWLRRDDIVAITTSRTNINTLRGEIVRQQQLENAQLVSCTNEDAEDLIRYQIIDAENCRESWEERNDFGYTRLMAHQLGEWRKPRDEKNQKIQNAFQRFFEFPWVPQTNSIIYRWNEDIDGVYLDDESVDKSGYYLLGNIPKTNLPIYLDVRALVSHHTAILGVTGAGKTTMVFKLIKEIQESDILTICIDITGEYKNRVSDSDDFFDEDTKKKWNEEIQKIIDANKERNKSQADKDKVERASVAAINTAIATRIDALREEKKIVILEIPDISNTHFSLDFTQYVIQAILQYAKSIYVENLSKEEADRDKFQCCLVLEEAHTLVPENLGVGGDFGASKAVIDKISQIALQGRKYQVGFILISQRTATVKKTVLNQCNTMIAFRAYDETSFNFLANYFGDDYVREIIHLKNDGDSRYVIASGKAVVADRPVIVEIKK